MSSTYTGNPTGIEAPSSAPSLNVVPLGTMPSDGNGLNVASVAQRIKVALDGLAWTWDTTIGMLPTILSRANVWMGQQTFQAVTTVGDEIDSFNAGATAADWSLFLNGNFGSLGHFRLYYNSGSVCLTRNSFYTAGSPGIWTQDINTLNASRLLLTNNLFKYQYHVAVVGTWIDSLWVDVIGVDGTTDLATFVQDIVSTNGSITASAGNIEAKGAPSGNAGPGISRSKRIYTRGTALVGGTVGMGGVAGDFTLSSGWGSTASVTCTGDDVSGSVTVNATGAGLAANPTVTLNFKGGTWTTAPNGIWALASTTITATDQVPITFSFTATTASVRYLFTPTSGRDYTFSWIHVGYKA